MSTLESTWPAPNIAAASAIRPAVASRPDEQAREHPARVLDVMQPRMEDRVDVEPRDVPDREVRRPERERDLRPQEEREDRTDVAVAGDRPEHARGKQEDEQRPADGHDHQCDPEI